MHRVQSSVPAITAKTLNEHYALISTDAAYTPPLVKSTSFEEDSQISEFQIFYILDHLRHTALGLDGIPAWFLRLAEPVLAAPIADLFNMSLTASCSLAMEDGSYTPHPQNTISFWTF